MKDMTSPETIRKILEMRKSGNSYREISRELKIDAKKARKYCVLYDLDGIKTSKERQYEADVKKIIKLYTEKEMTPNEIAREMHKSAEAIRLTLYKQGLWEKRAYVRVEEGKFVDKPMPPLELKSEPIYYPEREFKPKTVVINGKKYQDVSEMYGI